MEQKKNASLAHRLLITGGILIGVGFILYGLLFQTNAPMDTATAGGMDTFHTFCRKIPH